MKPLAAKVLVWLALLMQVVVALGPRHGGVICLGDAACDGGRAGGAGGVDERASVGSACCDHRHEDHHPDEAEARGGCGHASVVGAAAHEPEGRTSHGETCGCTDIRLPDRDGRDRGPISVDEMARLLRPAPNGIGVVAGLIGDEGRRAGMSGDSDGAASGAPPDAEGLLSTRLLI